MQFSRLLAAQEGGGQSGMSVTIPCPVSTDFAAPSHRCMPRGPRGLCSAGAESSELRGAHRSLPVHLLKQRGLLGLHMLGRRMWPRHPGFPPQVMGVYHHRPTACGLKWAREREAAPCAQEEDASLSLLLQNTPHYGCQHPGSDCS